MGRFNSRKSFPSSTDPALTDKSSSFTSNSFRESNNEYVSILRSSEGLPTYHDQPNICNSASSFVLTPIDEPSRTRGYTFHAQCEPINQGTGTNVVLPVSCNLDSVATPPRPFLISTVFPHSMQLNNQPPNLGL